MGMTITIPHPNLFSRLLTIAAGITVLIWSGFEDNNVLGVTVLGWMLATVLVTVLTLSRYGGQKITHSEFLKLSPLWGAIIGASATLAVVLLMLFKDIRHGHIFPDYPPQMMLDMLTRLPFWSVSGGLILLAIALFWSLRPLQSDDRGDTIPSD